MKHTLSDNQIEELARHSLQSSERELDAETRHTLQLAREVALQAQSTRSPVWMNAGVFASLLLVCVVAWQGYMRIDPAPDELLMVEELIQLDEHQELVDDMEFYQWLADTYVDGEQV